MLGHLLIRADANIRMGTGHIMRCLALGQAWQDAGGSVSVLTAELTQSLESRLAAEAMRIIAIAAEPGTREDADQTIRSAREAGAKWIIVDGYQFDADYQRAIKEADLRLVFVDDYGHAAHYRADLVLNQNLGAAESLYTKREPYTRLLLGPRFALLRREFMAWRNTPREIPEAAKKILVTLGGSDPDNVTLKVIRALDEMRVEGLRAVVVIGGSNPYRAELEAAAAASTGSIRVVCDVQNMPELMAWADVAFSAGGTTSWERCLMGLPSLVAALADNQKPIVRHLTAAGIAEAMDDSELQVPLIAKRLNHLIGDTRAREDMSRQSRTLVDGQGAERVVMFLQGRILRVRSATMDDCRMIWTWSNDPVIRSVSFSKEPIPWENHVQWFKDKMIDSNARFYVGVDADDAPAGQARFNIDGDAATISVSLAATHRGRGLGVALIQEASRRLFASTAVKQIDAYVKTDNLVSVRAFERAGYRAAAATSIHGQPAHHFVGTRENL